MSGRPLRVALAVATLVVAAGCGGQPSIDDYCAQLREDRAQIAELVGAQDPGELLDDLDLLDGLRDQAPRDLRGEWDTFLDALEGLRGALADAGVDASDFEDGEPPASLSPRERRGIVAAANRVRDEDVIAAASGIETQARDVCKINLGL